MAETPEALKAVRPRPHCRRCRGRRSRTRRRPADWQGGARIGEVGLAYLMIGIASHGTDSRTSDLPVFMAIGGGIVAG